MKRPSFLHLINFQSILVMYISKIYIICYYVSANDNALWWLIHIWGVSSLYILVVIVTFRGNKYTYSWYYLRFNCICTMQLLVIAHIIMQRLYLIGDT